MTEDNASIHEFSPAELEFLATNGYSSPDAFTQRFSSWELAKKFLENSMHHVTETEALNSSESGEGEN